MLSVWAVGFVHTAVASLLYARAGEGVVFVYLFVALYRICDCREENMMIDLPFILSRRRSNKVWKGGQAWSL